MPENVDDESQPSTESSHIDWATVSGSLIWIAIIAGVVFSVYHTESAEVMLNVSTRVPLAVSGTVTNRGAPVAAGSVRVTIEDAKDKHYLGGAVLPVSGTGDFASDPQKPLPEVAPDASLLVTAQFSGQTSGKPVTGTGTVYVNLTPPLGNAMWWIVGCVGALMLVLIVLFTGPLTKGKARLLFCFTYLVTFASCMIPIALTLFISLHPYTLEIMENAPVGILKGKAGALEPQWLLNIGGVVSKPASKSAAAKTPSETKTALAPGAGAATPAAPAVVPDASPQPAPKPVSSQANPPAPAADATSDVQYDTVVGGLAIPLYVIILATLGAGINMTRKVPEIQKTFDSVPGNWRGALTAPLALFGFGGASEPIQAATATAVRKELIEVYMYFLSAPFLAIAVYYLLQVVAKSVADPVLVVVAFATGLMSNTVVGTIIAFADRILAQARQDQQAATPPPLAPESEGEPAPSGGPAAQASLVQGTPSSHTDPGQAGKPAPPGEPPDVPSAQPGPAAQPGSAPQGEAKP